MLLVSPFEDANIEDLAFAAFGVVRVEVVGCVEPMLERFRGVAILRLAPSKLSFSGLFVPALFGLLTRPPAAPVFVEKLIPPMPGVFTRLSSKSFALILRYLCARLPSVIRPSAFSASSAEVFALRRPSSSASPSATDFRGSKRGSFADGVAIELPGRPIEVREAVRPGVVDGGRAALEAILERGRLELTDDGRS